MIRQTDYLKEEGLLIRPEFSDIQMYLQSGNRTKVTEEIQKIANRINGESDGMLVRNILVWMNQNTIRLHNGNDTRKFKRTATDIIQSQDRTGCCDSSTLFTTIARSKGIPTMQIITLGKQWARKVDRGEKCGTSGHYFTACYLKNIFKEANWIVIDSDQSVRDVREVKLGLLNLQNRNIRNFYAFAYVKDYSDMMVLVRQLSRKP